jgi:hypothetical protein
VKRAAWSAALCLAAAIVVEGSPVARVQHDSSTTSGRQALDEERRAAERLTTRICTDCHALSAITAERRTPPAWVAIVDEMVMRSPDATPAEVATIRQFLTRTAGIVAVNSAPAADFVTVLGLSRAAAEAVVAHRSAHGTFAGLDALLEVPGLVRSSLEREAQALWFD